LRGGGNLKARLLQLQKQLAPLGLYIKDVSGDGNCFYRAVADQVDGLEANYMVFKNLAIEFISQNKDVFKEFLPSEVNINDYILNVSSDGAWGDFFEILALCYVLTELLLIRLR